MLELRGDGSGYLFSFDGLVVPGCGAAWNFTVTTRTVATGKLAPEAAAPDLDGNCVADMVIASFTGNGTKVYSVLERPARAGAADLSGLTTRMASFAPGAAFGVAERFPAGRPSSNVLLGGRKCVDFRPWGGSVPRCGGSASDRLI